MGRLLALAAALIAAAVIAWADARPPAPAPLAAPVTAFSAERAMADVTAIASVPHPVGSPADRAARDTLVRRMAAMGLDPQVRRGVGVERPKFAPNVVLGGYVENIIGVLPGRDHSLPALALMAHYDSVPASTGASDDAAGVSSALEIVRAIKARGAPARDVIVLITDGEEAGLLGADAFFRTDPMAARVGFVINMEARGSAGRAQMFQTGTDNGGAVRLMAASAKRPLASSLTGFIYQHMPNDTDFTVSRQAGAPGLNYAFVGRQFDYHSPSSTPATQDRATLQDMGDQVLGPAMAIAFAPTLPARSGDLVYGQTPGGVTLAYPPLVGWAILAGAAALLAWGVVRARKIQAFPWLDLARGAGAALFMLTTGAAVLHFARKATGAAMGFMEQRFLLAQAPRWEIALFLLGVGVLLVAATELARGRRLVALLPLAAGLASCLFGGLDKTALIEGALGVLLALAAYGRPVSRPGAWAGVLLISLVLAAVAQAAAPTAAFVIAWPVALAALAAAVTAAGAHRGSGALLILALSGTVGLAFAADFAHPAYLSLDLPELLVLPLLMAALAAWPLAQTDEGAPPARLFGVVLILAGLAVTLSVRLNHPYDARHPQATEIAYEVDQDARKAWRVSSTPDLPAWSAAALKGGGGAIGKRPSGRREVLRDAAPAAYVEAPAPKITLARQPDGQLRLHIEPPAGVRVLDLRLTADTAATITAIGGAALQMPMKPGGDTLLRWSSVQPGFDLVIRPGGPGKLKAEYAATLEQWPSGVAPLPPRPAHVMPFDLSDSTVFEGVRHFTW
ncbi:M20/M25/M40 family metallo-hydrolase [Phenylobacterium sp.]|uniref:M20/M25/M40 family metallo-hydrolase n=1 Tax=Phenylobacterium sp. TaxID=1871053 RepID=UPI0011FABF59|nr:M20/M25/M40 family metallo-hydrolase [Phenylobacterium sp.]THD56397.1 MAG: M20/M25/M40 family metallo-hydrolase [Phenylobacterium sp.]